MRRKEQLAFICYELQKNSKMVTTREKKKEKTLKPRGASSPKSVKRITPFVWPDVKHSCVITPTAALLGHGKITWCFAVTTGTY